MCNAVRKTGLQRTVPQLRMGKCRCDVSGGMREVGGREKGRGGEPGQRMPHSGFNLTISESI
jgi:hypothetical protein